MASYDGSIRINTSVDTTSFNSGVKGMLSGLKSIAGAVGVAFSVAALVKFGKEAIELSSDLAEVDNVVNKSFGDMRGEMDALADTAIETLGMSRLTAYQTGSTFMSMGKSMLDSSEDAKTMALELTKLTGNMASFYNVSQDTASTALKSIYTGETETLKQYGVVMTEVNLKQFAMEQGITKSYSAMSQAEKVALRYQYVTSQLSFIGDDFVDTQDSWANQTRILSEQWKEFMTICGNGLVTVLTPLIKILNSAVANLITFANAVSAALSSVFGLKQQTMSVSDSVDETASSYDDAASSADDYAEATENAAKAAKGSLASFDELNNTTSSSSSGSDSSGSSGGSSGTSSGSTVDVVDEEAQESQIGLLQQKLSQLSGFISGIQSSIEAGWQSAFNPIEAGFSIATIQSNCAGIVSAIQGIFTDPTVIGGFTSLANAWATDLGVIAGNMTTTGLNIGVGITGGIEQWLTTESPNIKSYLVNMCSIGEQLGEIQAGWSEVMATISGAFASPEFQSCVANFTGIISSAFMGSTQLSWQFSADVGSAILKPFQDNAPKISSVMTGLFGTLSTVLGSIKKTIQDTFSKLEEVYNNSFGPAIDNISTGVSDLLSVCLDFWEENLQPIIDDIATDVSDLIANNVQPAINDAISIIGLLSEAIDVIWNAVLVPLIAWLVQNILPIIKPIINTLWTTTKTAITGITNIVGGMLKAIKGVLSFIKDVFAGDWEAAWGDIKTVFSGFLQGLEGIAQVALAPVIGVFTDFKDKVKTTFTVLWSGVKGIINSIISGIETMANAVVAGINAVITCMNGLSFDIPDWVPEFGGKKFGFDIELLKKISIPRLANGGITTGSTLANIGEAGREAILPLEANTAWMDDLASKLADKMSNSVSVYLEGDAEGLFSAIRTEDARYMRSTGHSAFGY